jgi:hypothetical protein
MADVGNLFRSEIGIDPIPVTYDITAHGLGPITGTLAAHEDPDFARKNIGERFTLVTSGGTHKIHIAITSETGDFVGDGLVPIV